MSPSFTEDLRATLRDHLAQFAEVALLGRETRVGHYEQPVFAWR